MTITAQFLVDDERLMPVYGNEDDAGLDVFSNEDIQIPVGETRAVHTGVRAALPCGFVALIWDRSSMARKLNVTTIGGVIDAGYRGEWLILLHNLGTRPVEITRFQKIAQALIQPVERVTIQKASSLSESERGEKGFGSTGT